MASNNSHHVSVDHLLLGKEAYIDAFFKILVKKLSDKQLNSLEVILKHQKDERIKIGNNNGDTKNIISPSNGEGI
jgi:hypothetical protein